jgi:ankyrin repeat protein
MKHTRVGTSVVAGAQLADTAWASALLALVLISPVTSAATYKCAGTDGSTVYADTPCGPGAKAQQAVTATPSAVAPSRPTATPLTPEIIAAAQDKSAREAMAMQCSDQRFNSWVKAQGRPLPQPNIRVAKLIEISNQCRRPLHLPDMVDTVDRTPPKPILSGPAGDAGAALLAGLVKSGSIEQLRKYLASPGVDINDRPGTDEALLDYAAEQNQGEVAKFLIEQGAHVNAMQNQGRNRGLTALHRAATADAAEVAEQLLVHGAVVNVHGPLGITPLILAASNGSRRTAEVLLNHGADISTPTGHNETALSEATAHGHEDIVKLLLIHVPVPTTDSMTTVAARGDLDTLRLMLGHDELVHDVGTPTKDLALRFTILGGSNRPEERKQMIELLLAHGADVNNRVNGARNIPLMLASTPQILEVLIAHGADLQAQVPYGTIVEAISCNLAVTDPIGMLNVLLAHGVDIAATPKTGTGSGGMQCAVASHRPELEAYLHAHGVPSGSMGGP